jgi:transcription initiation factor TFIID subunit 8
LLKIYFDFIEVMSETANSTKNYAELAGRTQPVVGDVVMAMINMGMAMKDLDVRN